MKTFLVAGGQRHFNLSRWFAIVSLLTIAAISASSATLLSWFLTERLLLQEAVLTKEFVQSLFQVEKSLHAYMAQPSAGIPQETEEAFKLIAAMPNVLRANVYGLKRAVIWSSDRELVGLIGLIMRLSSVCNNWCLNMYQLSTRNQQFELTRVNYWGRAE